VTTTDFISGYVRRNVQAGEPRSVSFKTKSTSLSHSSFIWSRETTRECKY
jgi:hypothetical protein